MRKTGVLILLLLSGCVTSSGSHGLRPLRPLEIPLAPYQETVNSALTGSLLYEGNCLLFRDEATGGRLLPIWPLGTIFNGTSVIFHQPGKADQRVMIAEEFVMSGQSLQWDALSATYYLPFQRYCAAQPFFVSRVRPAD
jgi:hypothetical protein